MNSTICRTIPRETQNLIRSPEHQQRMSQMREQLFQRLKETNGLAIPLGYKRHEGSNQRKPGRIEAGGIPFLSPSRCS